MTVTGSGGVGGSEFIVAPLTTTLQNPSNISLDTINVALPVVFNGVTIGRAAINVRGISIRHDDLYLSHSRQEFNLQPGENIVPTEFHYEPADANDTVAQVRILNSFLLISTSHYGFQAFLSQFIQTGNAIDLSIVGDSDSTPFASLQAALSGLRLSTSLDGEHFSYVYASESLNCDQALTNLLSSQTSMFLSHLTLL